MTMHLYLDIETIGTTDPDIVAEIAANIAPPGNISKAETIAAWERDSKPVAVDLAVRKTAFDGAYGSVICVGLAIDNAQAVTICGAEPTLLTALASELRAVSPIQAVVVGHNITWDVRFLWQRYIVHGMTPPKVITKAAKAKPWEIDDTMLMWNPERDKRISLDNLCRALKVQTSKQDLDGSRVWDAYKAGEIDRIAAYCKDDVEATRACYQRMSA